MQTAIVLLAFIALSSAGKSVQISGIFQNAPANQWSAQHVHIWNSDKVGVNYAINNVYFEVLVSSSDQASDRLGVFYGYNSPVGAIGSIMGNSSGVGTFYVFGDAGTYNLNVVTYYGSGSIVQKALSFVVGGTQVASRDTEADMPSTLVAKTEDFNLYAARDGSNNDMTGSTGTDTFAAVSGAVSWNTYWMESIASITNVAVTYSMNTTGYLPNQVFFTNPGLNGTASTWIAAHNYHLNFAINAPSSNGATWYVNINISYKKSGVAKSWTMAYPFIATDGKRSVERAAAKTFAQTAVENADHATKLGYAFGAAGAAVGVIAAVAIVAALITVRKNRQAAISA